MATSAWMSRHRVALGQLRPRRYRGCRATLDPLKLESDPKIQVLGLLTLEGYAVYAERLKPFLAKALGGKGHRGKE